jgi:hypothetical protein
MLAAEVVGELRGEPELPENSAEYAFVLRLLRGLWFGREEAAGLPGHCAFYQLVHPGEDVE